MKRVCPPTEPKALTGEFTPPGVTAFARSNSSADRAVFCEVGVDGELDAEEVMDPILGQRPTVTNRPCSAAVLSASAGSAAVPGGFSAGLPDDR